MPRPLAVDGFASGCGYSVVLSTTTALLLRLPFIITPVVAAMTLSRLDNNNYYIFDKLVEESARQKLVEGGGWRDPPVA